jgi:NAD(P)-dependent dehydrogenase (short-subunit alcohol dehydrogenase family)
MTGNVKGKVTVITGAASGIGKHMAEKFAEAGAHSVIADLNLE